MLIGSNTTDSEEFGCDSACDRCTKRCLFYARELCPGWYDPREGEKPCQDQIEVGKCLFLYVDYQCEEDAPCSACCDEGYCPLCSSVWAVCNRDEEGKDLVRCYTDSGNGYFEGCCDNKYTDTGNCGANIPTNSCAPKAYAEWVNGDSLCDPIKPVYLYEGKCYALVRLGEIDCNKTTITCTDDSPDVGLDWPGFWGNPCTTCDSDFVIRPLCDWDAQLVDENTETYGSTAILCRKLGCPGCCCDDGPPGNGDCCDENPKPEFECDDDEQCCEYEDGCECKPLTNNQGQAIDCEGNFDPCEQFSICCPPGIASHQIQVKVEFKSAHDFGGECACSGGKDGLHAEAFGGITYTGPAPPPPNPDDPNPPYRVDILCGPQQNQLNCSRGDMCGHAPGMPNYGPKMSAQTRCLANCNQIDQACCPSSPPYRITDSIECSGFIGPYPIGLMYPLCPHGCSMFGDRHLGLNFNIDFSVSCSRVLSANFYEINEQNAQLRIPTIAIGYICGDQVSGLCSGDLSCCFGGTSGASEPGVWSIGSVGDTIVNGTFTGFVDWASGTSNCTNGQTTSSVTFTPNSNNPSQWGPLLPLTWSMSDSPVGHWCRDLAQQARWLDLDNLMTTAPWIGSPAEAKRYRENCGPGPIDKISPRGPILAEVIAAAQANPGVTVWPANRFLSCVDVLQGDLLNESARYPGNNYSKVYSYGGWGGCSLSGGLHPCNNCFGSIVDLQKKSWSVGKVQGGMQYFVR